MKNSFIAKYGKYVQDIMLDGYPSHEPKFSKEIV